MATISIAGCLDADDSETADEDDEDDLEAVGSDGLIYAFTSDRISILDPETGEFIDEITDDIEDLSWADPQLTHDQGLIFAVEETLDQVYVIDTETRHVETAIDVGPGSNHIYHPTDDEIWVHADDDGAFYVIDVETLEVTDIVEAGLEGAGHGKLLYHEEMGETGYATNVDDAGLSIIDLESYERTDFVEFGDVGGTHYKAYSPRNGFAYVEYFGQTVVVDTDDNEVVEELEFTGGMFLSPDERHLAIVDDEVHLIDVTDEDSEELAALSIDGDPSTVRFDPDGEYAFVASADSADVAVIDLEGREEIDRLEVGEIDGRSRMAVTGGSYFITPTDADESVAVVDMDAWDVDVIDVDTPVETIQYVGDSGMGYTGTIR